MCETEIFSECKIDNWMYINVKNMKAKFINSLSISDFIIPIFFQITIAIFDDFFKTLQCVLSTIHFEK